MLSMGVGRVRLLSSMFLKAWKKSCNAFYKFSCIFDSGPEVLVNILWNI